MNLDLASVAIGMVAGCILGPLVLLVLAEVARRRQLERMRQMYAVKPMDRRPALRVVGGRSWER